MTSLSLQNIRPGTLRDARLGSIFFPLGDYSAHFLVTGGAQDELFGVFLSGNYLFHTVMASKDGDNWAGFFVDGVRVEVDVNSAVDATHGRPPLGSVVKRPTGAFLVGMPVGRDNLRGGVELRLGEGGSSQGATSGVAFPRWSVVAGEGASKSVLWNTDDPSGI